MELSILQRIILQSILPSEGDYITYKIIRDLKGELAFSEDEIKKFNITQEIIKEKSRILWDNKWNGSNDALKRISIGPKALDMIIKALEELNSQKKINDQTIDLYEMFVNKKIT